MKIPLKSELFLDRNYQEIYYFFEKISEIPRESGHEREISEYLAQFAKERDLDWIRDEYFNVLIRKPGSPGWEMEPPVLLECHSDMVCVKKEGVSHDFRKDPIRLIRESSEILRADGTSLGADNGCGMAICLAVLAREDLCHPPLECLFAAQEETGLVGVSHFDVSKIQARRVIGLDAGSDGVFCKGTTTKHCLTIEKQVQWEMKSEPGWVFKVEGLRGGYPALCLPMERASAVTIAGELLCELARSCDVRLGEVRAASRGIPETCFCEFCTAMEEDDLRSFLHRAEKRLRVEYGEVEAELNLILKRTDCHGVMGKEDSLAVARLLALLPFGVFGRNLDRMDLIHAFALCKEVNLCPGENGKFSLAVSTDTSEKYERILGNIKTVLELLGAEIVEDFVETGWDVFRQSPIRDVMCAAFQTLYGKEPYIKISHGGNDCVELYKRIPGMDIVTTAADYINFHTPDEYLVLETFEREYELVIKTLELLCKKGM